MEINGIKLEADLREAKRIDSVTIGDNVEVYIDDCGLCDVRHGIITDVSLYGENVILVIATLVYDQNNLPQIDFIRISNGDGCKIMKVDGEELCMTKSGLLEIFELEIQKRKDEALELEKRLCFFKENFLKKCGFLVAECDVEDK